MQELRKIVSKLDYTNEDKEACLPLIEQIIDIANKARKKGLLALEEDLANADMFLLKKALELIIDGCDPDLVKDILYNYVVISDDTSSEIILKRILVVDGIISLQQGLNPRLITEKLMSYLGINFYERANAYVSKSLEEIYENIQIQRLNSETSLDKLMYKLDDISMQRILREVDYTTLGIALINANGDTLQFILRNVSDRIRRLLKLEMSYAKSKSIEDIKKAQDIIENTIKNLKRDGEILYKEEINMILYDKEKEIK